MLKINGLKASINDKSILNGLDLEIKAGEVHAIMGPNGSERVHLQMFCQVKADTKSQGISHLMVRI